MGNRPDFIAAIREEIGHPRFWVLLCIALVFFLAATVWDITYLSDPEWVAADAERVWFAKAKTWIGVLKEMGFASLIALIIAVVIERSSRARLEMTAARREREIAESVYRGVFETELPKALVNEVVNTVLKSKIIRLNHRAHYVLDDKTRQVGDKTYRYVRLTANTSYSLKNVSTEEIVVPIKLGFPLPGNPYLHDLPKLNSFSIDGRVLSKDEVTAGDKAVPNLPNLQRYRWDRKLGPGQTVEVTGSVTLIKDRSDNEVWTSLYPSDSIHLSVTMSCRDMVYGAMPQHPGELKEVAGDPNTGHYEWELAEPVLPFQGVVFWCTQRNQTSEALIGDHNWVITHWI